MEGILFWIFSVQSVLGGIMTITVNNPVYSALYLIYTFMNASGILFLLGLEFIGIIFLIVYIGAVAILFLFVVMMLNIRVIDLNENITRFLPISLTMGLIFIYESVVVLKKYSNIDELGSDWEDWTLWMVSYTNVERIGQVLYTEYSSWLLIASMILLVAMIGAIVLGIDRQKKIRRQDMYSQMESKWSSSFYN